jgi:hypothetical protein
MLAGTLLVAGAALHVAWSGVLVLSDTPVSEADFESWPRLARTMRRTVAVWILANLLGLAGFAVTTTLLAALDHGVSVIALVLLAMAVTFVILEGTHHVTLGIWSAEEALAGDRPAFSAPLAGWAAGAFQAVFYGLGMAALGLYGGAILIAEELPAAAGWFAVGWGSAGLAAYPLRNRLTWALVVPVQLVVGIALLIEG